MSSKKAVKKLHSLSELAEVKIEPKKQPNRAAMIKAGLKPRKAIVKAPLAVVQSPKAPKVEDNTPIAADVVDNDTSELLDEAATTHAMDDAQAIEKQKEPSAAEGITEAVGDTATVIDGIVSSEGEIVEIDIDGELQKIHERREALIVSLLEYASADKAKELRAVYEILPVMKLEELLTLMQAEWGGSPQFKATIEAAEKLFKSASNSRGNKAKQSVLAAKYKEFNLLAQKVEKALGFDTVISGLKLTSYQNLLKTMITHHSALSQGIREMAEMISLTVPETEDDNGTPVPANTHEQLRVLLSIGISAKNWMMTANEAVLHNRRLQAENVMISNNLKMVNDALKESRAAYTAREEELRKATHARFGQKYVLVNVAGKFLALEEDAESINPKLLRFVEKLEHALTFNTQERMNLVYDKLRRWSRKDSKYAKIMHKKGLRPENLSTAVVTLTRV